MAFWVTLKERGHEGEATQAFSSVLEGLRERDNMFELLLRYWIPDGYEASVTACLQNLEHLLPSYRLNATCMGRLAQACAKRESPLKLSQLKLYQT